MTWFCQRHPKSNGCDQWINLFKPYKFCLKHFSQKCFVFEIFDRFRIFDTSCIYRCEHSIARLQKASEPTSEEDRDQSFQPSRKKYLKKNQKVAQRRIRILHIRADLLRDFLLSFIYKNILKTLMIYSIIYVSRE